MKKKILVALCVLMTVSLLGQTNKNSQGEMLEQLQVGGYLENAWVRYDCTGIFRSDTLNRGALSTLRAKGEYLILEFTVKNVNTPEVYENVSGAISIVLADQEANGIMYTHSFGAKATEGYFPYERVEAQIGETKKAMRVWDIQKGKQYFLSFTNPFGAKKTYAIVNPK